MKSARDKKGLSQRAFAKSIGLPQSRLSRIETGNVDLRASNLLELARTLDLELMLIPRHLVPAVNNLIRGFNDPEAISEEIPLYNLDEGAENES